MLERINAMRLEAAKLQARAASIASLHPEDAEFCQLRASELLLAANRMAFA